MQMRHIEDTNKTGPQSNVVQKPVEHPHTRLAKSWISARILRFTTSTRQNCGSENLTAKSRTSASKEKASLRTGF